MEDADAMVASSFGLVQLYRLPFWAMQIFADYIGFGVQLFEET
jgi:hypothetical protein